MGEVRHRIITAFEYPIRIELIEGGVDMERELLLARAVIGC